MKKFKGLMCIGIVGLLLCACNSISVDDNDNPDSSIVVTPTDFICKDINKASSLFIASRSSASSNLIKAANNGSTSVLFMVTDEGYVEEVTFKYVDIVYTYDDAGNIIGERYVEHSECHVNTPKAIRNINDDYLMLLFEEQPRDNDPTENFNYLINKKTGRCYKMPFGFVPHKAYCNNYYFDDVVPDREMFMSDNEGNIYFMAYEYSASAMYNMSYPIKKLDLHDPNNITAKSVTLKNDDVDFNSMPAVSKNGGVAYYGKNDSSNISRYVKKDGSFSNLGINSWTTDFWTGYDGYVYCLKDNYVQKIKETDEGIEFEQYGTQADGVTMAFYYTKNENKGRVYLDNQKKILQIGNNSIVEIYNEETNDISSTSYDSLEIKRPKLHSSSKDFLYFYGMDNNNDNVLLKIDPSNGYEKTLLMKNIYDISSFVVNDDNSITFNGLRFTDGAYVIGTVDSAGEINVSDIVFDNKVDTLICI